MRAGERSWRYRPTKRHFLASDASRLVSGLDLVVDAGISAGWPIAAVRDDRARFRKTFQPSEKKRGGSFRAPPAGSRFCFKWLYQANLSPSSSVRLPPLKMNLFRNCDEVTKM